MDTQTAQQILIDAGLQHLREMQVIGVDEFDATLVPSVLTLSHGEIDGAEQVVDWLNASGHPDYYLSVISITPGDVELDRVRGLVLPVVVRVFLSKKEIPFPPLSTVYNLNGGAGRVLAAAGEQRLIRSLVPGDDFEAWVEIDGLLARPPQVGDVVGYEA